MLSLIPEKQAALTTLGLTISLAFVENFLAQKLASPAKPPIEAPIPVGIMLDTRGPEVRVKKFENNRIELKQGQSFTFVKEDILGNENCVIIERSQN